MLVDLLLLLFTASVVGGVVREPFGPFPFGGLAASLRFWTWVDSAKGAGD